MAVNWTIEQLKDEIDEILLGERIVFLSSSNRYVLFSYPSKQYFRLADLEEKQAIEKAKEDGFLTIDEMNRLLVERGIWKPEYDERLDELSNKIKGLKEVRDNPNFTKTEKRKKILTESIQKHELEMVEIQAIKERYLSKTVERSTQHIKFEFLAWSSSYDPFTRER